MPKKIFTEEDPPIRTELRFPESLWESLKIEATKKHISLNELVINKLSQHSNK